METEFIDLCRPDTHAIIIGQVIQYNNDKKIVFLKTCTLNVPSSKNSCLQKKDIMKMQKVLMAPNISTSVVQKIRSINHLPVDVSMVDGIGLQVGIKQHRIICNVKNYFNGVNYV